MTGKRLKLSIMGVLVLYCAIYSGRWAAAVGSDSIPPSYHWGRGISWPAANFNLGGYVNAAYEHPQHLQDKFSLNQWSFFLTWSPHQRLRFFSEIEVDEWLSTEEIKDVEQALKVERLYVDWLATDTTTVRLGKYLTPIGRWNVTHAAPLMWTTTRPLVTEEHLFSPHLNGILLTQKLQIGEHNIDVSLYADNSAHLDVLDKEYGAANAYGGRINIELLEHLQIGASFINFKHEKIQEAEGLSEILEDRLEDNHALARDSLAGVDLLWKQDGYEIALEAIYRHANDFKGNEKGLYLQGVAPLSPTLFAVGRYEYVDGTHYYTPTHTHLGIAGLAWRPYVPLVIKAEYRLGTGNEVVAPNGFFASIAMFF